MWTYTRLTIIAALAGILSSAIANSLAVAQGQLTEGCSTNSFATPSWLVQNFAFAGSNTTFRVLNRATNTSADLVCIGSGSCTASAPIGLSALVQLNGTSSRVLLRQTWLCNDVKPSVKPPQVNSCRRRTMKLTQN